MTYRGLRSLVLLLAACDAGSTPTDAGDGTDAGRDAGSGDCAGMADGTACGDGDICLDGECVASECGDGFIDPAREEDCEDMNDVPFDGCEPGTCQFTCDEIADCDDGESCNGAETCAAVACADPSNGMCCGAGA